MTDGIIRSVVRGSSITQVPYPMPVEVIAYLLDEYPGATVAYSLRKLSDSYAGDAVRIRRSSDNAEADIGFSGEDFDAAAAASHIGGGTGFIATWYDQSGNGIDVTQATAGAQPEYNAAGVLSKPTTEFVGFSGMFRANTDYTAIWDNSSMTNLSVFESVGTGSGLQQALFAWDTGGGNRILTLSPYNGTLYFDLGNDTGSGRTSAAQPGGFDNTPIIIEHYRDTGNTQAILVNASSVVSGSRSATCSTDPTVPWCIGCTNVALLFALNGFVSELVIWSPDLGSTDRTGARNNMNAYYGVF